MHTQQSIKSIISNLALAATAEYAEGRSQAFKHAILTLHFDNPSQESRHTVREHLVNYCNTLAAKLQQNDDPDIQRNAVLALIAFDTWYTELKSRNQDFQDLMINARDGKTSLTRFRTVLIDEAGRETSFYTTRSDNAVTKALKAALRKARSTQIYQENKDNVAFIIEDIIARRRHNRAWQTTKKLPVIAAHFVLAFAFPVNVLAVAAKATFTFLGKIGVTLGAKIGFGSGGATTGLGIGAWVNKKKLSWKARIRRWFGKSPEYSLSARVQAAARAQAARAQAARAKEAREQAAREQAAREQICSTIKILEQWVDTIREHPEVISLIPVLIQTTSITTHVTNPDHQATSVCREHNVTGMYSGLISLFISYNNQQRARDSRWQPKLDSQLVKLFRLQHRLPKPESTPTDISTMPARPTKHVCFIDGVNPGQKASYDRQPTNKITVYPDPQTHIDTLLTRGPIDSVLTFRKDPYEQPNTSSELPYTNPTEYDTITSIGEMLTATKASIPVPTHSL